MRRAECAVTNKQGRCTYNTTFNTYIQNYHGYNKLTKSQIARQHTPASHLAPWCVKKMGAFENSASFVVVFIGHAHSSFCKMVRHIT